MTFAESDRVEAMFQEIVKARTSISKIHQCQGSDVTTVVVINWSAPALLKAESFRCHAATAGVAVNELGCVNVGIVLNPLHSNQRGLLWQEDQKCREPLASASVNCDSNSVLACNTRNTRNDMREMRPGQWQLLLLIYF